MHHTTEHRCITIAVAIFTVLAPLAVAKRASVLSSQAVNKEIWTISKGKELGQAGKAWIGPTISAGLLLPHNSEKTLGRPFIQAGYQKESHITQALGEALGPKKRTIVPVIPESAIGDILVLLQHSRSLRDAGKFQEALESIDMATEKVARLKKDAVVKELIELPVHISRFDILITLERYHEAFLSIDRVLKYIERESVSSLIKEDSGFLGSAPFSAYYKAALSSKYINIKRASEFLDKGIQLLESSAFGNRPESDSVYLEYARFFHILGQRQQAFKIYLMLAERYIKNKSLADSAQYASILSSLADLSMIEGDFGIAELLLQGALSIYSEAQGLHYYDYQWTRVALAKLQGRIEDALSIAEDIEITAYKEDNRDQVLRALSGQIVFAGQLSNSGKMTKVFSRFGELPKTYFSSQMKTTHAQDIVIILTALSERYLTLGLVSEARKTLDPALGLALRELGTGNFLTIKSLLALARIDEYLDMKRAIAMYRRIAKISSENDLHIQAIDSLSRLSLLEAQSGNMKQATFEAMAHSNVYLKFLFDILPSLTRGDRINAVNLNDSSVLHSLSSVYQPAVRAGLWAAINERGLLNHIEIHQRRSAQNGKHNKLARRLNSLAAISLAENPKLDGGNRQKKRNTQLLLNQLTPFQPSREFFDISNLLDSLPKGSTYIHIIRYRKHSFKVNSDSIDFYGAYVSSQEGLIFVDIGNASDIDGIILDARQSTGSNLSDSKQKLNQVYQQAVAPWIKEVRKDSEIYLSLDSEMNIMPIESLYVDKLGDQVVADLYNIKLVSSPRDHVTGLIGNAIPKSSRSAIFANPDYAPKNYSNIHAIRTRHKELEIPASLRYWKPLQHAGAEGVLISSTIRSTLFEKENASEENIKAVNSPLVLHIAAHAFYDPIKSEEALPAERGARSISLYERIEHYLHGSGIALATPLGEVDQYIDGILTAAEASRLDLLGTELVVLSACSTGDGVSTSGLGVFGLQRSFIEAGAKSVLTSLWKVDDQSTAEFMHRFYILIKGGISRNEAIRIVRKDFREGRVGNGQWKDPYYWAAWQLVGDWRPIQGL